MATNKERRIFYLDKITDKKLEQFWHKHNFVSRSRAIAWLIAWALSKEPVPPPQKDDEYYD